MREAINVSFCTSPQCKKDDVVSSTPNVSRRLNVDEDWLVTRECVSLEAMPSIQMSGILPLKRSPNGNGASRSSAFLRY
jgi:hypothetical protein